MTTSPEDEIPPPSEPILSGEETARQLKADFEKPLRCEIDSLRRAIHAAHGLIAPLSNQVTPSVTAIREAVSILRRHL